MVLIGEQVNACGDIPDLYGMIIASRDNAPCIRRPCRSQHPSCMATVDGRSIASGGIPDPHGLVIARRGDVPSIRRPQCRPYPINMSGVDEERRPALRVPNAHGVVGTRRGDPAVIERPCYRMHSLGMVRVGEEQRSGSSIMHLNDLIFTPKGKAFPVMRPCHGVLRSGRVIRGGFVPGSWRPYLHHMILACRGNELAIRRPFGVIDLIMMPTEGVERARSGGRSCLTRRSRLSMTKGPPANPATRYACHGQSCQSCQHRPS